MRVFFRPPAGGAVLPLKQERRFSDLAPESPSDLQITASLLKEEGAAARQAELPPCTREGRAKTPETKRTLPDVSSLFKPHLCKQSALA